MGRLNGSCPGLCDAAGHMTFGRIVALPAMQPLSCIAVQRDTVPSTLGMTKPIDFTRRYARDVLPSTNTCLLGPVLLLGLLVLP